jgi:ABC-type multidrug transport system ATPase subunit
MSTSHIKEKDESSSTDLPILSFQNVSFSFQKGTALLRDINYSIFLKKNLILTGVNGSGKSTLLKMIAGVYAPLKGKVVLHETIHRSLAAHKRMLYTALSVEENLRFFADLQGIPFEIVTAQMEAWNISEFANKKVGALSQGQASRVSLCRAFTAFPIETFYINYTNTSYTNTDYTKLLLLDEPTTSLDSASLDILAKNLEKFTSENPKSTIIISTHDINFFEGIFQLQHAVVENGKIVETSSF